MIKKTGILIEKIAATDYVKNIKQKLPLIIPLGAIEQHGAHLPLGTDTQIANGLATELAKQIPVIIAPSLQYGCRSLPRSGAGDHFTGTTSLSGCAFTDALSDILFSYIEDGNRHLLLLNAHYENYQFASEAIHDVLYRCDAALRKKLKIIYVAYWDLIPIKVIKEIFSDHFISWEVEHGGLLETSLMLALHPTLVDMKKLKKQSPFYNLPYDVYPLSLSRSSKTGCLSSGENATKEKGKALIRTILSEIKKIIEAEF